MEVEVVGVALGWGVMPVAETRRLALSGVLEGERF
jgi:hypothetical protein